MAEEEDLDDKTEEATQHRRDEWKREGRVSQSKELSSAIMLLALTLVLFFSSSWYLRGMGSIAEGSFEEIIRFSRHDWNIESFYKIIQFSVTAFIKVMLPLGVAAIIVGVLSSILQVGFIFSTKPLEWDILKLNPQKALKRIFGIEGIVDLLKAVVKFAVVGSVLAFYFLDLYKDLPYLWGLESREIMIFLGPQILKLLAYVGISMLVISILDYGFQRFQFERRIKMTKEEAKQDRKRTEGDPQLKARVRAVQRQVAQRRMMDAVKKADVVITNPTHIAIALMFDREEMLAPKVVARGADHMAEKIKQIARESGVPCVENVPLARALYKAMKIGQLISRDFYNAVAEVLAYVYRLKGKGM